MNLRDSWRTKREAGATMLPETHLEPPNDNVIPEAPALQTIDAQSPSLIIAPPAAEAEPDARSHVPPTTPLPQGGSPAAVTTPAVESRPPPILVFASPGDAAPNASATAAPTGDATVFELSVGTPTPREAAYRLAKYTQEVKSMVQSPLIKSPPKQMPLQRKPPLPIRSSCIAAQKLDHIPASKRGEVLLMKKMGVAPPAAPPFSVAKRSYKTYFKGPLDSNQVAALDELFPAVSNRAGRVTRRPMAVAD